MTKTIEHFEFISDEEEMRRYWFAMLYTHTAKECVDEIMRALNNMAEASDGG